MAVEHRNIPEDGLHEPKGISNAAVHRVYTADGAGSGNWSLVDADSMQGIISNTTNSGEYLKTDGSGGVQSSASVPWGEVTNIPTEFSPVPDEVITIVASKAEIAALTEIADPTTATAEDVANKVNAVIQALQAGV